eukprot:1161276-Pelagomonas_calceolata.AAC.3
MQKAVNNDERFTVRKQKHTAVSQCAMIWCDRDVAVRKQAVGERTRLADEEADFPWPTLTPVQQRQEAPNPFLEAVQHPHWTAHHPPQTQPWLLPWNTFQTYAATLTVDSLGSTSGVDVADQKQSCACLHRLV